MDKTSVLVAQNESMRRAELNLERLIEWIPRHDTKASILFGVQAGMIGAIATSLPPSAALMTTFEFYSILITIGILGIAIIFNCLGMFPNIRGPKQSLLFFCAIAGKSFREFEKKWLHQKDDDYLGDLLEQIHVNSMIAERKFFWIKKAYVSTFIGTLPWTVSIYFLHR